MNSNINDNLAIRIENIQAILPVKDMAVSKAFYINILGLKKQIGELIISQA